MTPDEITRLLREAHQQPIEEAHFAAVRARVLAAIAVRPRQSSWGRWVWLCALPALTAAVLLLSVQGRFPSTSVPAHNSLAPVESLRAVASEPPPTPDLPTLTANTEAAAPMKAARGRSLHRFRAASAEHRAPLQPARAYGIVGPPNLRPMVVKLVTDDPTVVIYWISQGSGE